MKKSVSATAKKTNKTSKYCFVKLIVRVPEGYEEAYICGNTANLGAWNAAKAVKLKKSDDAFVIRKRFPVGAKIEYKALSCRNWGRVEKGAFGEELQNNCFTAEKGIIVQRNVATFNNEYFD